MTILDSSITNSSAMLGAWWRFGSGILLVRDRECAAVSGCDLNLEGTTKVLGNQELHDSGIAARMTDNTMPWSVTGAEGRVSGDTGSEQWECSDSNGATRSTATSGLV